MEKVEKDWKVTECALSDGCARVAIQRRGEGSIEEIVIRLTPEKLYAWYHAEKKLGQKREH